MGGLTKAENFKLIDDSIEFDHDLRRRNHLILAQPLQPPPTAVTVRVREGQRSRTDGPFAETKEFLGGFFLIEARDLDEAAGLAEVSPMAEMGSIEVRPFLDHTHSLTGEKRPQLKT
jgi:hypothetical protein